MKRLFSFILVYLLFTIAPIVSAATQQEETDCIDILNDNLKTQYSVDLDSFFYYEKGWDIWDKLEKLDFNYQLFDTLFTNAKPGGSQNLWKIPTTYKNAFGNIKSGDYILGVFDPKWVDTTKPSTYNMGLGRQSFNAFATTNSYKKPLSFYADGDIKENRRNNIGTVTTQDTWNPSDNYIRTKFISFWLPTDFVFPYEWKKIGANYTFANMGDKYLKTGWSYSNFKLLDRVIYLHYLNDGKWTFLSCGYLRFRPPANITKNENNSDYQDALKDLDPQLYYSNVIPTWKGSDGGFELLDPSIVKNGNRFLVGKVLIAAENASQNPLMNIDVLTVAYDNQSTFFNEYETFPHQVKEMTNADAFGNVNQLQLKFLNAIVDKTCLQLLHPDKATLPAICWGQYISLSAKNPIVFLEKLKQIALFIRDLSMIPMASARLNEGEYDKNIVPSGKTIMVNSDVSLVQTNKINAIPNKDFIRAFQYAINDQVETRISTLLQSWTILEPYDQIFHLCWFSLDERKKLLLSWLDTLDVSNFDIDNLTYPDPKIWDCVLPFPDKRHKNLYITGSFFSNQINVQLSEWKAMKDVKIVEPNYLSGVVVPVLEPQSVFFTDWFWQVIGLLLLVSGWISLYFIYHKPV
jgi:hypothetical protein